MQDNVETTDTDIDGLSEEPTIETTLKAPDLLFAIAATASAEGGLTMSMLRQLYAEYGFMANWELGVSGTSDELLSLLLDDCDRDLPIDDPEPIDSY